MLKLNKIMKKICIVGDNCVDLYSGTPEKMYVGGNGINNAVASIRNGAPTAYVGVVGNDKQGKLVVETLKNEDIDISHIVVLEGKTAWTKVELNNGDRVFVDESLGIQSKFDLTNKQYEYIKKFDLVHHTLFSNWPTASAGGVDDYYNKISSQITKIHNNGSKISVDLSEQYDEKLLMSLKDKVEIAFFSRPALNDNELKVELKKLGKFRFSIIVITMGAKGSIGFDGKKIIEQPAIPTVVVDTLGVGDSFIGAFLSNWLNNRKLSSAILCAAEYAAKICRIHGAFEPKSKT